MASICAVGEVKIARAPDWLFEITAERGSDIPATSPQMRRQAPSVVLVRTSEIEPERIGWLWPGIIARGKITGLVGYPGLGKSQVAIDVASTVSTGRLWPGGAQMATPARSSFWPRRMMQPTRSFLVLSPPARISPMSTS